MKSKLLLIGLLAILLTGCSEYRYDVKYEKCNGNTGSITMKTEPVMFDRERKLSEWYFETLVIRNVCDFSYTKTEEGSNSLIQDNQ